MMSSGGEARIEVAFDTVVFPVMTHPVLVK